MKKQIILTVGCSGSGKSTWTEQFTKGTRDWLNINRDDVRFNLFSNGIRDWTKYKFNHKNEKRVTAICEEYVEIAYRQGRNLIISDTNINPKIRQKWKDWADEHDYEYSEKAFPCDWVTLEQRNNQRQGGISTTILRNQYLRMNDYLNRKTYEPDLSKPEAVLIDIDGTVASMVGVRKPYEWDKVHLDKPRKEIIAMLQGLLEDNYIPIFLSGRDGSCSEKTYDWIMENIMYWYLPENGGFHLFMREEGDSRKDDIVKEEIFWKYIADNFNVVSAIDDRNSIIRLWEELKIPNIINVNGSLYNEF